MVCVVGLGFIGLIEGMLSTPLAVNPVIPPVATAVQLKVTPATEEEGITTAVGFPEHMVCATGRSTSGLGAMVYT